jgi:hypothetical protein
MHREALPLIATFLEKIKESVISVVPVMTLVMFLHFTIAPLTPGQLPQFLAGGVLLILGLSIFLVGADIGMVSFGQRVGSALTYKRSLPLMLVASFAIGFAITVAEPDVQVLATQVSSFVPSINRDLLLLMIAVGVGLFLLVGTGRIIVQVPLRVLLVVFYVLLFASCGLVDAGFVGVAFDAGGATTGPITVPFIMAMGIGVASAGKKKDGGDNDSFGLVGLASIGPIAAVVCIGVLSGGSMGDDAGGSAAEKAVGLGAFVELLPHVVREIFMALLPIVLIFLAFQFLLLRLPSQQVRRTLFGFFYAYVGLVVFMTGVSGGFSPAGESLGMALGKLAGGWVLVPVGFVVGAVVVCAEPAVWILTEQIEEVSGGYIKRAIMLAALSISIAMAVVLGMLRVVTGLSIWWILLPGYGLALVLTRFCPSLFTAIAFDSGGVASGPMATTFVLSLTLGAATSLGRNPATDAFGMIAMIAMAPLITIQLLGIVFKHLEAKKAAREEARKSERREDGAGSCVRTR